MGDWDVFEELGIVPDIVIYDATGSFEIKALDFPTIAKGSSTITHTVRIKNNAVGSLAKNCVLKVRSFWYSFSGYEPIDENWIKAKCVIYGDTDFGEIDNDTGKPFGYAAATQTIPFNQYADVNIKIDVPLIAKGKIFHILFDVIYDYS